MWPLIDGVAGIILGCAAALAILAIRISARRAVVTWRMSKPARGRVAGPELEDLGAPAQLQSR